MLTIRFGSDTFFPYAWGLSLGLAFLFYLRHYHEVNMFNLISDPWIPTSRGLLSLSQTLDQSDALQLELSGIQFAAVLRLLLAVCYQSGATSHNILQQGIPSSTLKNLERYKKKFDLHDGFLTCPDLTAKPRTVVTLFSDSPSGDTMVFHGHTWDAVPPKVTNAELVLRLLEFHCAAPGFGKSVTGGRSLSPCADVVLGIAMGKTLLETLALNLVPDPQKPTATWILPRAKQSDFKLKTRDHPSSIAERYTWLGQSVRFLPDGVGTARGFKLPAIGDPMTATALGRDGQENSVLRPFNLESWLLACRLLGLGTIPAATLTHAESLDLPFKLRVIAQVSSQRNKAKIIERIDSTFDLQLLNLELAAQVLKLRSAIAYLDSEFAARCFVSTLEDYLHLKGSDFRLEEFIANCPIPLRPQHKEILFKTVVNVVERIV
jgi:CRISPR-associated protein Cse1 (CRISPR_cse1)